MPVMIGILRAWLDWICWQVKLLVLLSALPIRGRFVHGSPETPPLIIEV
jgi:hypothetical protein